MCDGLQQFAAGLRIGQTVALQHTSALTREIRVARFSHTQPKKPRRPLRYLGNTSGRGIAWLPWRGLKKLLLCY